jgi:hypothetical protein
VRREIAAASHDGHEQIDEVVRKELAKRVKTTKPKGKKPKQAAG